MPSNINNIYLNPNYGVSGQALTVSTVAVSLFGTTPPSVATKFVLIDVQAQPVTVTYGGEVPAPGTVGHALPSGFTDIWTVGRALRAKFIRTGASDAVVYASEFVL